MARYSRDPYWITTKRRGECVKCKTAIAKGEQAFYYPLERKTCCKGCGEGASAEFEAARFDEDFGAR